MGSGVHARHLMTGTHRDSPADLRCSAPPMNVDYSTLAQDIYDGRFRQNLEEELTVGFRILHQAGDPLPLASYYASKIAEIVNQGSSEPIDSDLAFHLYQEILSACEAARATVLGEPVIPS